MQLYEEAKANNRMKYDGGKPSKIGEKESSSNP